MRVEIWTDITCPWCGVGKARFEAALSKFPYPEQLELVYRSYQLAPKAPLGETEPVLSMLARKYQRSEAELQVMTERVQALAEIEGIKPYHVGDNRVGNTVLAHEFAHWATAQGKGDQVWDLLFSAYFGEKHDIFQAESLASLAPRLELDREAALLALQERRYASAVEADADRAKRVGVTGVPFFLMDGRFGIPGAQEPGAILGIMLEAWVTQEGGNPYASTGHGSDELVSAHMRAVTSGGGGGCGGGHDHHHDHGHHHHDHGHHHGEEGGCCSDGACGSGAGGGHEGSCCSDGACGSEAEAASESTCCSSGACC